MNIGIIGAGRIGRLHAGNLCGRVKGVRVKSIADPLMNDDLRAWVRSIGIARAETDPEIILDDREIDAVFICSPTDTHADLIVRSAGAGKHIFCEKPVGSDPAIIRKAVDAARAAGIKLQVGFVRRFDHNHGAVAEAIRSGRIGRVELIKVTSRDPAPPPIGYVKRSGGLFFDMMIHDFDMARFLAGSEVTEVYARGAALIDARIEEAGDVDTAVVTLSFESGALGVIDNSRRAAYGYDQRTEVHGSLGCVQTGNDTASRAAVSTADGVHTEKPLWFFLERYNDAFIREAEAFRDACTLDSEAPVTGEDAYRNAVIAMAAARSLRERRPVAIDEILGDMG